MDCGQRGVAMLKNAVLPKNNSLLLGVIVLAAMLFMLSGCGLRKAAPGGQPIEPITPGEEKGETQTLQGRFAVKTSDVQIYDLSVTEDGSLAVVGSAARAVYLLERDGKLLWEKSLNSVPLWTSIDPAGRAVAIGTAGGRLLMLNADQTIRFDLELGAPVRFLSVTADSGLVVAGVAPEDGETPHKAVVLDRTGRVLWEFEAGELLGAKVAGDNRVYLNWQDGPDPSVGVFTPGGERLFEIGGMKNMTVAENGLLVLAAKDREVFAYDTNGEQLWKLQVPGEISRLLVSGNGMNAGVLVRDEATQQEELLFLDGEGAVLWSRRLPVESEILLSRDGRRVIVASWRQYRDDATQVLVYNLKGQEVHSLEVAGRTQRMALSGHGGILALGLEDGSIFFLNIGESTAAKNQTSMANYGERTLQQYYRPVDFAREQGESRLSLFFYDETSQALLPVTRRVKRAQSLLRASLDELVRGPVQGSFLQRTIPKDVEIAFSLEDNVLLLDLPPVLNEMSGVTFLSGVVDSLLLTVSQFPVVEQVRFTVGGEARETFGSDGILINGNYLPYRFGHRTGERLVFTPYRSGDRYYLRPVSKEFLPLKDLALIEAIVLQVLGEGADFLPEGIRLRAVQMEGHTVLLDFSQPMAALASGGPENAAKAALVRDALALSIAENLPYTTLKITVEGKMPVLPAGHLPWELTVSRPYFINPED